ncbi:MAG: 2,3-bisphosphoglycerate-independent phosphoglycerate mutase, partial [Oscillospiraceae bacterium]
MLKKPLALIIMDGYGNRDNDYGNAIHSAKKPNLDRLFKSGAVTEIGASGLDVGLPDGQMGNSEVGHTNMGAGRVVYQELTRITKSIKDGDFFENENLLKAINSAKQNDTALHIMGLLSDGGVHSHNDHLYGLLELAKKQGLTKVFVHCFMDGRDVPPSSGADYIASLEAKIKEIGVGTIATVMGRYYAMDRDNRWERVEKAYSAIVYGKGETAENAKSAMQISYDKKLTDEFVLPT